MRLIIFRVFLMCEKYCIEVFEKNCERKYPIENQMVVNTKKTLFGEFTTL